MSRWTTDELANAKTVLHAEDRPVRFQDVDAAGIIFFARVFEYFHDAFVTKLDQIGLGLPALLRDGAWKMPIVHAEADYLGPMRFGDRVVVEVVRSEIGEKSVMIGYRIRSPEGRPLAVGHAVHVCVDAKTFRSTSVPAEVREAFKNAEEQAAKGA